MAMIKSILSNKVTEIPARLVTILVTYNIFIQNYVRIIAKRTIRDFWEKHPDSEQALKTWYKEASREIWNDPHQVKQHFRKASILGKNRVIFNICGNKYRLITEIDYSKSWIFVRFIGTHKYYDNIDPYTV